MEFSVIKNSDKEGRVGKLIYTIQFDNLNTDTICNEEIIIQTPCCLLNTNGGTINYLTPDLMKKYLDSSLLSINLSEIYLSPHAKQQSNISDISIIGEKVGNEPKTEAEFLHLNKSICILKFHTNVSDFGDDLYKKCKEKYFPLKSSHGVLEVNIQI